IRLQAMSFGDLGPVRGTGARSSRAANRRAAFRERMMLFGKQQSLVGLDIGSHTIKAVELESQANKTWRMTRWGISAPLADAIVDGEIMDRQLVTDAISNLFESRGIRSRNVVAAVSGRAVIVKKIVMNK